MEDEAPATVMETSHSGRERTKRTKRRHRDDMTSPSDDSPSVERGRKKKKRKGKKKHNRRTSTSSSSSSRSRSSSSSDRGQKKKRRRKKKHYRSSSSDSSSSSSSVGSRSSCSNSPSPSRDKKKKKKKDKKLRKSEKKEQKKLERRLKKMRKKSLLTLDLVSTLSKEAQDEIKSKLMEERVWKRIEKSTCNYCHKLCRDVQLCWEKHDTVCGNNDVINTDAKPGNEAVDVNDFEGAPEPVEEITIEEISETKTKVAARMNTMKPEMIEKYTCSYCRKFCRDMPHLRRHLAVHEEGRKTFVCEHCSKAFAASYRLKDHVNMVHLKLYPFHCSKCGKGFAKRKRTERHELECKGDPRASMNESEAAACEIEAVIVQDEDVGEDEEVIEAKT
ncbi:uncharacterized protein [Clytia hemisphaerica]|uniref:C2H2-type domain-containing protein n=1 Tax=Clytia hemisphaerica TaxID=252671 RepID=A0A7M5V656_9CNID